MRGWMRKLGVGLLVAPCFLSGTRASPPDDPAELWARVVRPAFDAKNAALLEGLVLTRDVATIEFSLGTLGFAEPVNGRVFAASFRGKGRLKVTPTRSLDMQQLQLHMRAATLDQEFTEATFLFSDATFEEVSKQVRFGTGDASNLQGAYAGRASSLVDRGIGWEHRALKAVLAGDPAPHRFFRAEFRIAGAGWISLALDASRPEEFRLFAYDDRETFWVPNTFVQAPAGRRSIEEAYRGHEARQDFLIERYRIEAACGGDAELNAVASLDLKVRRAGERVLLFTLDPNLRVSEVKDAAGRAWAFFQPRDPRRDPFLGEYLAVVAPEGVPAGALTLEFRYGGKEVIRKEGSGVFFAQSYGWYPGYDDDEFTFATRSNFELTLRVPRKYQAVATGKKFEEAVEGDWLRTRWQSEIPLAVAGFAYGGYEVQIQQVGKVQVEVYANKNPDDLLRTIEVIADDTMPEQNRRINPLSGLGSLSPARLRKEMVTEMANAVQFFQKSFGPYPFEKLAMANIPSWYAYGQGWPGLIYLSAISFLDPVQRTQLGLGGFEGELTDRWRSHEIAHNWWGHAVSWQSYHDQWLSEGFAEYSALLYTFVRRGPDEFFKTLRWNRDQLLHKDRYGVVHEQIGPIYAGWRLTSARHNYGYRYVVYMKGAWVLHMIRMMLFDTNNPKDPDHRFVAMMQEFTKTYYNKPAATEDFKRIVEKHMTPQMDMDGNRRMDWFFNQWVYGTGIPQYRLAYSIEPGQQPNTFTLKGRLIQAGVPPTFKMPVPLYFTKGKNTILAGWIPAVGPETPFEVPISFKPDKVTLNESEDILSIPPK